MQATSSRRLSSECDQHQAESSGMVWLASRPYPRPTQSRNIRSSASVVVVKASQVVSVHAQADAALTRSLGAAPPGGSPLACGPLVGPRWCRPLLSSLLMLTAPPRVVLWSGCLLAPLASFMVGLCPLVASQCPRGRGSTVSSLLCPSGIFCII